MSTWAQDFSDRVAAPHKGNAPCKVRPPRSTRLVRYMPALGKQAPISLLTCIHVLLFVGVATAEEDLNSQLMRATVKISHEKSTATGFILWHATAERFVLVTANHVLTKTPGPETTVIYRSLERDGSYQKRPTKLDIRKDERPLWTAHPTEDIAVMWVDPPPGIDLPLLSPELLADDRGLAAEKIHAGQLLACLGYPHREESSKAGFAVLRSGVIASFPLLPVRTYHTFLLSCNTFEGDSGGVVFLSRPDASDPAREQTRLILGLIIAQQFIDEEMKMMYGSSVVRHRLGLAIVVQAAFIRKAISRLP